MAVTANNTPLRTARCQEVAACAIGQLCLRGPLAHLGLMPSQVINTKGTQVVDTWAFNAEDMKASIMLIACLPACCAAAVSTHGLTATAGAHEHGAHPLGHQAADSGCG